MPTWYDRVKRFVRRRRRPTDPVSLLASLADSLDDAIIGLANDGMVVLWNTAVQRLSGRDAEDVLGCPITSIVPQEFRGEVADMVQQVIRQSRGALWTGNLVGKLGEPVPVAAVVRAVRDEFGTVRGAVMVVRHGSDALTPRHRPNDGLMGKLEPILNKGDGPNSTGAELDAGVSDEDLLASVEQLLQEDRPSRKRPGPTVRPGDRDNSLRGFFGPRLGEEPLPKSPGGENPRDLTELHQDWLGFRGFFLN